jgi:hypothetical protein
MSTDDFCIWTVPGRPTDYGLIIRRLGIKKFLAVFGGIPGNFDGLLSFGFPIPTGLKHQAQGCEERG